MKESPAPMERPRWSDCPRSWCQNYMKCGDTNNCPTFDQSVFSERADSGWIPWAGGECPVAGDALVDVTWKETKSVCDRIFAGILCWDAPRLGETIGVIAAYRLSRQEDQGASAAQDKAIDAGRTDRMSAAEARPTPSPCREDGRCQYAIDHGAEGMAACPVGKCAHMDSAEPAEG